MMVILPIQTFAMSDNSSANPSVTISQLQEQIKILQAQIAELTAKLTTTQTEVATIKEELRLTKTLKLGMTDGEVSKLQSFLKTMPDVYPEGLVTGYFGQLTAKAVKKFQEKNAGDVLKPLGLSEGTGMVGAKTMEKMNKVMAESAMTNVGGATVNNATIKEEKVTLCHFPPENPINKQTITVGASAVLAHKAHGDAVGACTIEQLPPVTTTPTPVPASRYYINITTPNRNETWTTGSSYYIKWSSNIPDTHKIMIVRVRDSAGSEFTLLRDTLNDGIELLTVPSTLASGIYHFEMQTVFGNQTAFSEIEGTITIVNQNNPSLTPVTQTKIITPSVAGGRGVLGGTSVVAVGSDQTFTITPMPGYQVASVIVDGVDQGSTMAYTFTNVQTDHSIVVSFSPIQPAPVAQHTITVTQGTNGIISPSTISVANNGSQTFTIAPVAGSQTASVIVDGVDQGAISSYTFSNVQAPHTITATFTAIPSNLPVPTDFKVGFGIGSGVVNWVKISESFTFKFDFASLANVSAFRLYQKKPQDSSYSMVGEFSNPSGLTSCSTKRTYGTWTLNSLGGGPTGCPGSSWYLTRTSAYPVSNYTVGDYFYYLTAVNTAGVEGLPSLFSYITFLGTFPIQTPITVETAGTVNPTFRWQPAGGSSQLLSYWVIVAPSDGSGSQIMLTPFSSSGLNISKVYDGPALIPGKQYSVWIYGRSHNALQTEDIDSYASEVATFIAPSVI